MATFTLKVTLKEVEPEVSRTIQVSSDSSLYLLHHVIQESMGWKNYHLYHFKTPEINLGDLRLLLEDGYDEMDMNPVEGKTVMVEDIFTQVGQTIEYIYDYGDDWEHTIELLEIDKEPLLITLPVIVSGKNACPPEDCGGPHGYAALKKILKNPS